MFDFFRVPGKSGGGGGEKGEKKDKKGLRRPLCLMKTKRGICGRMEARFDGTVSGPRDCGK